MSKSSWERLSWLPESRNLCDLVCCLFTACPGGKPGSFWHSAALQSVFVSFKSSLTVGCCMKITFQCQCCFRTLNCSPLCPLNHREISPNAQKSLNPEHSTGMQCYYTLWFYFQCLCSILCFFFFVLFLFTWSLSVLDHDLTVCLTVCIFSALLENKIMSYFYYYWTKIHMLTFLFSLLLYSLLGDFSSINISQNETNEYN